MNPENLRELVKSYVNFVPTDWDIDNFVLKK